VVSLWLEGSLSRGLEELVMDVELYFKLAIRHVQDVAIFDVSSVQEIRTSLPFPPNPYSLRDMLTF